MYHENSTHKGLGCLIESYLKEQFDVSLAPAQLEVLTKMLAYDNVLFRHGRAVGSTFILATLSAIIQLFNTDVSMAIASTVVRQAKSVASAAEHGYNLKLLNVVPIKEAIHGGYDILILDEVANLPKEHIESLIKCIKKKSISKIVSACSGYRTYYPVAELEKHMYSDDDSVVITKNYEDMPSDFFVPENIEEAKTSYEHEEEFNMEYKGLII